MRSKCKKAWLTSVISPCRLGRAAPGGQKVVETKAKVFIRSEEHTSELQSLMRISYAVFCLKKKIQSIIRIDASRLIIIDHIYEYQNSCYSLLIINIPMMQYRPQR